MDEVPLSTAETARGARRRVLVIAMNYPPMRGVGSLRLAGFVRHLPEFGWDPTVATVDDSHLDAHRDPSLLRFARSDVPVVRVASLAYYLNHQMRALAGVLRRLRPSSRTSNGGDAAPKAMRAWGPTRALMSTYDWLFLPNTYLPWALGVAARCGSLAAHADVIYSSGLPLGSHIAAGLLAWRTGRPWVADFRDLLFVGETKMPSRVHGRVALAIEGWAARQATLVMTTTDTMTQQLIRRHGRAETARAITITNGFDRAAVIGRHRSQAADQRPYFCIAQVGRTYGEEGLGTLLRALRELIDSGAIPADRVRFEYVGHKTPAHVRQVAEMGLEEVCVFRGLLPQQEAFQAMLDADVLFVDACGDVAMFCVRAKLFEYMLTGNPVLGVAGEGPTRHLIEQTRIGRCAAPGDVADLKSAIQTFFRLHQERSLRAWARRANIDAFDRRLLAQRLAQEMDALVRTRSPAGRRGSRGE